MIMKISLKSSLEVELVNMQTEMLKVLFYFHCFTVSIISVVFFYLRIAHKYLTSNIQIIVVY